MENDVSMKEKNRVNSVAKAFCVLQAFTPAEPELTISEVAVRAGQDRGTAFRLLHTLVELGYVVAVSGTRRFRLGLKCLELGFNVLASQGLRKWAAPLLGDLVPRLADAGSLGVHEQGEVVYLERVNINLARHGLDRRPGSRTGAYASALGQAILAYLPREQQHAALNAVERIKLSERTLVDMDALLARLDLVREQGYAASDGENAYGLRTLAVPILDSRGQPVAGVSLTIDANRMSMADFMQAALPELLNTAQSLSQAHLHTAG
ncbi:MAG: IclR family transcriptional regulator C-terminal domain-containing protein [Corticimicrobacter sp.]|uniref:IclR family transcriptional regulator n=1 Tax=Corticimicrobacter sp. TaxID=2678536 RepID=UPI0032DB9795